MSKANWKIEILARWEELGLEEYCHKLGINFEDSFRTPLENSTEILSPFSGFQFSWLKNSAISNGVLHLHPIKKPTSPVTWEEWFIHIDGLHHHILNNYIFEGFTDSWLGDDLNHPAQVNNVQWYLINDADMRPLALR